MPVDYTRWPGEDEVEYFRRLARENREMSRNATAAAYERRANILEETARAERLERNRQALEQYRMQQQATQPPSNARGIEQPSLGWNYQTIYAQSYRPNDEDVIQTAGPTAPTNEEQLMPDSKRAAYAANLLIGADPEFAVLEGGNLQNIQSYIPRTGMIGYDHGGYVVELRPTPSKTVHMMLKKLAALIDSQQLKAIERFKWQSGPHVKSTEANRTQVSLGGHIHFGHEIAQMAGSPFVNYKNYIATLAMLTRTLEDLDILPAEGCKARRRYGYGDHNDIRGADDGPHHWEYRAMPSWLFHPDTAMVCVTLAKLAVLHPKTVGDILRRGVENPRAAVVQCLQRFGRDIDARRVLDTLPVADSAKLVHDPTVEIREAWREQIASVKEDVAEVAQP